MTYPQPPYPPAPSASPPRRSPWLPLVVVGVVAALLGIVGTLVIQKATAAPAAAAQPTPTATVTVTAAPPPTVATTPAAPATPASATHTLGATVTTDDGTAKATVYAYKQPVATSAPKPDQAGYEWGAADVKLCIISGQSIVNDIPWTLTYADDTTASPSSVGYRQFPLPQYAFGDTPLNAGHCLRGWIVFVVPKGHRPATVHYALDDGTTIDWKV